MAQSQLVDLNLLCNRTENQPMLRSLIKSEIQKMLGYLSVAGEDSLVFIAGRDTTSYEILASTHGKAFAEQTDLSPLAERFRKFCKGINRSPVKKVTQKNQQAYTARIVKEQDCHQKSVTPQKVQAGTCVRSENNEGKSDTADVIHPDQEVLLEKMALNLPSLNQDQYEVHIEENSGTSNTSTIYIFCKDKGQGQGHSLVGTDVNQTALQHSKVLDQNVSEPLSDEDEVEDALSYEDYTETTDDLESVGSSYSREYTCRYCSQVFQHSSSLKRHCHNKHGPIMYKQRSEIDNSERDQQAHHQGNPSKQTKLKSTKKECQECGHVFQNHVALFKHKKRHHEEKTHQCLVCKKMFSYVWDLRRHEKTHKGFHSDTGDRLELEYTKAKSVEELLGFGVNQKKFFCIACHVGFLSEELLEMHNRNHNDSFSFQPSQQDILMVQTRDGRVYVCTFCGLILQSERSVILHKYRKHGTVKFACGFCGKEFPLKYGCQRHIRTHGVSDETTVSHVINLEEMNSQAEPDLQREINKLSVVESVRPRRPSVSTEQPEIVAGTGCSILKSGTSASKDNKKVIVVKLKKKAAETVDNSSKTVKTPKLCPTSGTSVVHSSSDQMENKTPNYECSLCDRSFHYSVSLEKHKAYIHAEKKFKCETCLILFQHKEQLDKHMKQHAV